MRRIAMATLILVGAVGGALSGVAFLGGGAPRAEAQDNTNSIVACYEDGTYRHVTWSNVGDLADNKNVVSVPVLISQSPGAPNILDVTGHDRYSFRRLQNALLIRWADVPPGPENSTERKIVDNGNDEGNRALGNGGTGNGIGGGMHVLLYSMDYQDPNYESMQARCVAKWGVFRAETVPAEGTY